MLSSMHLKNQLSLIIPKFRIFFFLIPENASSGRIALKWQISAQQEISVPSKGDDRQGKELQCLKLTRYLWSEYTGNPALARIQKLIIMVMEKRKSKNSLSKGRANRCRDRNTVWSPGWKCKIWLMNRQDSFTVGGYCAAAVTFLIWHSKGEGVSAPD